MARLIERYDALLLDSYGVLVDQSGPLPGSHALIQALDREQVPYFVVTNDASRLKSTIVAWYHGLGLPIPPERIIASGDLLAPYFAQRGLDSAACLVLGPEDSRELVTRAGGDIVNPTEYPHIDALIVCDESGFPFLETVDCALTCAIRVLDAGGELALLCPNPDLFFPKGERRFGIGAGSIAGLLEGILRQRYPEREIEFVRLGKPFAPLFREAERRANCHRLVMIGDQLATDILGAARFGIDSALVQTGLSRAEAAPQLEGVRPTYLLGSLEV
jgi:HAD superfamily hydrolase (TIGR01450 family)